MTTYELYVYYTIKNMPGGKTISSDADIQRIVGKPLGGGALMLSAGERVLNFSFQSMEDAQAAATALGAKGYKTKIKRVL